MAVDPSNPSAYALLAPWVARGMVLDLSAMQEALRASGSPELRTPCVHVAGTNGKGSVSALVSSVLLHAGLRVGTYTSPHLHRFVERIALDGSPVSEALAATHAEVMRAEVAAQTLPQLTFFEAATLLAWRIFREARVDLAVVEVGLGGRLDATRLCAPKVTVITRVALDHQAQLGDTPEAIAREKAGVLKAGVPCVLGPGLGPGAGGPRAVVEAVAREVGAPLVDTHHPVHAAGPGRVGFVFADTACEVALPLVGSHQRDNLATALTVLEVLRSGGLALSAEAVRAGVEAVRWPARIERVGRVIFDAAHNPDGTEALVRALPEALGGDRVGAVVFGASRDKDWPSMMNTLAEALPGVTWACTKADMARAEAPAHLAAHVGGQVYGSAAEALDASLEGCGPVGMVLVCGSIFLVAAARAHLLGIAQEPFVGL